jgi:hypothetical protein
MLRAAYRLAERMGRVDVDAMLAEMTMPEFQRWVEYMAVERSPSEMLPWLFGSVCMAIWNVQIAMTGSKEKPPTFHDITDHVLRLGDMPHPKELVPRESRRPPEEVFDNVVDSFAALGWKPVKDHRPVPNPAAISIKDEG